MLRSITAVIAGIAIGFTTLMAFSIWIVLTLGKERATEYFFDVGSSFYTLPQALTHFIAGVSTSLIAIKRRPEHAILNGLIMTCTQVMLETTVLDDDPSIDIKTATIYILCGTMVASFGGFAGQLITAAFSKRKRAMDDQYHWDYELLTGEKIPVQSSQRRPIMALLTRCAGTVAILAGVALCVLNSSSGNFNRSTLTMTGSCVTFGIYCFFRARRMTLKPIHEILKQPDQSPVLYLRSFEDDEEHGPQLVLPKIFLGLSVYKNTAETTIVDSFARLGPVIAVGKPGENLPTPGAVRLYVSHEHWQAVVSDLMQRVGAVVIRAGKSAGLAWEIKHAINMIEPERICIVIIPPSGYTKDQEKYFEEVRKATKENAGITFAEVGTTFGSYICDADRTLTKWTPTISHPLETYICDIDSDPLFSPTTLFGFRSERSLVIVFGVLVIVFIALIIYWRSR